MSQAPIVLFAYDRPEHLRATLEALAANDGAADSDLYAYSDGPKSRERRDAVEAVRERLRAASGFRSVTLTERPENLGLARSVIAGVSETLERHPAVIVVEDDLVTSRNFLAFVNAALETYEGRQDIFSVTGCNYPLAIPASYSEDAYLSYRGSSWGWGTWRDRWARVDWDVRDYDSFVADAREQELFKRGGDDLPAMLAAQMEGRLDSWSIRFDYAHYKHDAFCVYPVVSKVRNIGFDGSGVHGGDSEDGAAALDPGDRPFRLDPDLAPDASVLRAFDERFRPTRARRGRSPLRTAKRHLRRLASLADG